MVIACDPVGEVGLDAVTGDPPAAGTYAELPATRIATVLRDDSVLTAQKNNVLLGDLRDGLTGTTHAEAFFQVGPYTPNLTAAPAGAVADSLVLTLGFGQYYGTADGRLTLEAYELAAGFADDRTYYAESAGPATDATRKLGAGTFKLRYRPTTSKTLLPLFPWAVGDTAVIRPPAPGQLLQPVRLPLYQVSQPASNLPAGVALQQRLLAALGTPALASTTAMQALLNGVAVRPTTTGAIINVSPLANETRLVLYYHTPAEDSLSHVFSLGAPSAQRYFSQIRTDYAAGAYLQPFTTSTRPYKDTVGVSDDNAYTAVVQGSRELVTRFELPGLRELRARRATAVVNYAELVIPVKPNSTGVYPVPPSLYLLEVDNLNRPIVDIVTSGSVTASLDRTVQTNTADPTDFTQPVLLTYDATRRAYRATLTTYVTAYINDKLRDQRGAGYWLVPTLPSTPGISLNRALIDARPGQVKLRVYYSTLN